MSESIVKKINRKIHDYPIGATIWVQIPLIAINNKKIGVNNLWNQIISVQ